MTNFNYDTGVPFATNNPSVDQPNMLINTQSINGILAVDHVTFNENNGGTHEQVTFIGENPPTATPSDPTSIGYTNVGIAAPTHPQLYWQNSQGIFPLSAIRAFGSFTPAGTTPSLSNSFNILSSSFVSGTTYTFTLNANTVNGNNIVVLLTSSVDGPLNYSFSNPTLTISGAGVGSVVNFLIIQI